MLPASPAGSKLPPVIDRSPHPSVSGIPDPQQPHWPPSEVIDREVAKGFASQETQHLIASSHGFETLEKPSPPISPKQFSLTNVERNLVVEEESFTLVFQDSLAAFLPPQPPFFIGRKEQLEKLLKVLHEKGIVVIVPEQEIPCKTGKSTFASQYVKGNPSVLWISARSKRALDTSFSNLARLFHLETSLVRDYLSNQDRLIVFDGAKDSELLGNYIPQGKCRVIITSRNRDWSFPQIEMGPLNPEEAVDYLCQVTQKEDRATAKKIAEELDCLPTSLEKAAKMIVQHQTELAGYPGIKEGILDANNQRLKERSNLGQRNRNFTGRETSLVTLEEALKTTSRAVITAKRRVAAEVGLGGVGKTQIALQYAFRNADKYPYLVWRINCDSELTLQESYKDLAEKIGFYLTEEEKKKENALIKKVNQRLERETGWLLIYDNAENQKKLEEFIPHAGGHVLITSRSPDWDIGFADVFKVGVFKRKESIALVQKMTSLNTQESDQLAELVQDLPIAVAQAAAYIRETKIPYTEYARIFIEKSDRLLSTQEPTDEYSKTVNVTWQISMEKITEREKLQAQALYSPFPLAEPLMNLCAFLGSISIPRDFLLLTWVKHTFKRGESSLADLNRTLELLSDFSMIDLDEKSVSIHALVQLVTRSQMPPQKQEAIFEQAFITTNLQIELFDENDIDTWSQPRLCLPHATILFETPHLLQTIEIEKQVRFMLSIGNISLYFGNNQQALRVAEKCLTIAKPRNNSQDEAKSLNLLGKCYEDQGKFDNALDNFSQSLEIKQRTFGGNHPSVAQTLNKIGGCYRSRGKYDVAMEKYEEALKIQKSALEENHLDKASTFNHMGNCCQSQGQYNKALQMFEEALKIQQAKLRKNHPNIAMTFNNMGTCYRPQGEYVKASELHLKALSIREESLGKDHPHVAMSLDNIAICYAHLGRYDEALTMNNRALCIREQSFGKTHPAIATSLNNLGCFYFTQGRYKLALARFIASLNIRKEILSKDHADIGMSLNNVGMCYYSQGHFDEALKMHLQALTIREAALNKNHRHLAESLNNIGSCYHSQGKFNDALEKHNKALATLKECFGESYREKPDTAETFSSIGKCYFSQGKIDDALTMYEKALEIRRKAHGDNCLEVAECLNNIGTCYCSQGKFGEAMQQHGKAFEILKKLFINDHPETGKSLNGMGNSYFHLGTIVKAKESYQQAYDLAKNLLGESHSTTQSYKKDLDKMKT